MTALLNAIAMGMLGGLLMEAGDAPVNEYTVGGAFLLMMGGVLLGAET